MKKKVKMTCILKSGAIIKETVKLPVREIDTFNRMIDMLESPNSNLGKFTFGRTTITISEIAAISFKH